MQKLASIRICSFLTTKNDWVESSLYWHAQTKEIEDKLSDALHESLVTKFVNQRNTNLMRHLFNQKQKELYTFITNSGEVIIENQHIASIKGFNLEILNPISKEEAIFLLKNLQKIMGNYIPHQIHKLIHDDVKNFNFDYKKKLILWQNTSIAYFKRGNDFFHPEPILINKEIVPKNLQNLIIKQLNNFIDYYIHSLFDNFFNLYENPNKSPEIRGILHQLYENGGLINFQTPINLSKQTVRLLAKHNIHCGKHAIYYTKIFKNKHYQLRQMLLILSKQIINPTLINPQQVSYNLTSIMNKKFLKEMGWLIAGKQIIRLDIAENLTSKLQKAIKNNPIGFHKKLISPIPYQKNNLSALFKSLKLTLRKQKKLHDNFFGPPTPLLITKEIINKKQKIVKKQSFIKNSPFIILKNLTLN